MSRGSCSKGGKCSFEHDTEKMGKAKKIFQAARLKETLEKELVLRVSTAPEEIVVTIENMSSGISRITNTSRKISVAWERILRSHTRKRRIDLPVQKQKVRKKNPKERRQRLPFCVYCEHRPSTSSGKLFNSNLS